MESLITAENTLENEFLKAYFNEDGSVELTDKKTGHVYSCLLYTSQQKSTETDIGRGREIVTASDRKTSAFSASNGESRCFLDVYKRQVRSQLYPPACME